MIPRARTAAVLGSALVTICLFGCRPDPSVTPPEPAEPMAPPEPAEPTEPQAAALQENAPSDEPQAAAIPIDARDDAGNAAPLVDEDAENAEPLVDEDAGNTEPLLDNGGPQSRTAFYRVDGDQPAAIPPVFLSKADEAACRVKVGDTMPEMELDQLGGERRKLADLAGETATVVVFWKSDRHMARQELADLVPDVLEPYHQAGVAVVGIAVNESETQARDVLKASRERFPNLLDINGDAFAQVGSEKLPRTYLLDPQGKILWFDLEYSLATRRELHQALRAVTGK